MRALEIEVHAVVMRHDWLAPKSSLQFLLSKLGRSRARTDVLDDDALGARADHFAWMGQPEAVAERLIRQEPSAGR